LDGLKHLPVKTAFAVKIFCLCGVSLFATGCVETAAQRQPDPLTPPPTNMARRDGVSPHGASVSVIDVQGVPGPVAERLARALELQANGRDINFADPKKANYLVHGYLNTSPAPEGAEFAFVWDVYDAKKRHTQRIDDRVIVKGVPANLDQIDDAALTKIAAASAEDLAAVLTNTPEAIAAASSPASKNVSIARGADGGTSRVAGSPASVAATVPKDTGIGMAAALR
jgi:hypothetical protein